MITESDIGRRVVICAADEFYAYVDGWIGTFRGFHPTCGAPIVHVPSEEAECGYVELLVPQEQLSLTV